MRGEVRDLHLFEVVDADGILMAFAGEKHFDKVGGNAKLHAFAGVGERVRRERAVARRGGLTAGDEPLRPDALGHLRKRQPIESAAHVAGRIAELKTADQNLIERSAGDNAELA